MANIIESRVTLEDEVFEETIDTMEEPIEVVRPSSYNDLEDLPQVNGVTLMGNKTSEELGIVTATDIENAVSAEATLRENADTALGGRIDNEKTARENADTALGGRIDGEITNRTNVDNALGTRIDNEILARQGGDNNLQTQIDAITSKSDVVDVVADYAALQAYDTQHLGNNDVIKVLDDETHNDAQTYYRWNKTAGTWSYIGSEAPYYSKGQIDQQMQAKQDKLTAGTGITLDGSTISADTTVLATKEDLEPEIVAELPTVGDATKLYLTPTNKTASGNPITIDLKENIGQLTSFRLDGDTFQQTYTGQNLYNVAGVSTGTYVTKDDDGWITITRDNTSGDSTVYTNVWTSNLALETSTQYKIFIEVKAVSGTGSLFVTSTNSTQGQFNSWQEKKLANMVAGQTYTVAPTTKSSFSGISQGLRTVLEQTAGQGGSVTFRLSVCASSTPTDTFSYEPYVGGQPSPSPDYPQTIQTVTGEQTVSINGTDYPIDLGSIELCKLGTYQDYIYKDGENWKVHKATKAIYLKDITWLAAPTSVSGKYRMRTSTAPDDILAPADNNTKAAIKSSVYGVITAGDTYSAGATGISVQATTPHIFIYDPDYNTVSSPTAFTQKMASTNAKAYYALATATDTVITDTSLIAQFEAVRKATLANGQNTITNVATGANLAGSMSIGYYGYNPSEYSEWLYIDGAWEQVGGRPFPTNISEFENDADFVSENELQDIIAPKLQSEIVNELPAQGDEGKLYLTPKEYTRGTGTDNPITATITDEAGNMESFKLDGDTYQQSYTGKNLFNKNNATIYKAYIWSTEFVMRNNYTDRTFLIPCLPNTTYTVSRSIKTGSFRASYLDSDVVIPAPDSEPSTAATYTCGQYVVNNDGTSLTITTGANANRLIVHYGNTNNDANINESLATIQVEVGSSATSYEPYVGGVPSPNPDYPQQIQTVTGEQTVEVVGKNIFNPEATPWVQKVAYDANGEKVTWTGYYGIAEYQPVVPNTTYYFSNSLGKGMYYGLVYYDANREKISNVTSTTRTFTTPANCYYIRFAIGSNVTEAPTWTQLELGSTATSFAAYSKQTLPISLGSIELCKLGDYQDYIYKDGDDWKVHKELKKSLFDQNSGWAKNQYGTNAYGVKTEDVFTAVAEIGVISPQFIAKSYDGRTDAVDNVIFADSNGGMSITSRGISIRNTAWSDLTSFIAWVTLNPVTVYYVLATATDTTITDQTLIAQLEAIRTASLENGTNTITNTATGSNLAGDMELGYYEYDPTNRYDKWLWLDLNNNYEKLGS